MEPSQSEAFAKKWYISVVERVRVTGRGWVESKSESGLVWVRVRARVKVRVALREMAEDGARVDGMGKG